LATKIVIPDTMIKRLNELPREIRLKFWEQIEKLIKNPSYPGLRNEKLEGTNQWVFSITMNYRATYIRGESSIVITGIGTHKEVLGS
jgi:mRNA-degrading endonuclease RelE of RelBE toxin-antitoxin system